MTNLDDDRLRLRYIGSTDIAIDSIIGDLISLRAKNHHLKITQELRTSLQRSQRLSKTFKNLPMELELVEEIQLSTQSPEVGGDQAFGSRPASLLGSQNQGLMANPSLPQKSQH
jgi:hypothetical protein